MKVIVFGAGLALLELAPAGQEPTQARAADPPPEAIRFNRDVRPILSDRCFHCHGPDKQNRQANLRLDQAEGEQGAYRFRDGVQGLKPGDLKKSKVWHRITTDDENDIMPPVDSHKDPLTVAEKEVIKRWIEEGANYDTFWAFKKPEIVPPSSTGEWGNGPIDRYVHARLRKESLSPSREADKRTLLRRLTFDLTGLPPTLEELADFDSDLSPDAYEKRVDALLDRPQYGEHMTRYWADLVRLADTNGLHTDRYRDFSTYRNWVIRAFNSNMPFDQFIRDQIAGDLYENPTVDQLVASGFNRLNLMFERGSVLPEESLFRNVLDRVEAVGTAFLGLTVQCAQCHDHKYDPISQREFFQLYAFFNNFSGEPQTGPEEPDGIQSPFVEITTPEHEAKLTELDEQLQALQANLRATRKPGRSPPATAPTVQHWTFDDGIGTTATNRIGTGKAGTLMGSPTWVKPGVDSSGALDLNASNHDFVDGGNINLSSTAAGGQATVSMWLHPDNLSGDNRIIGQLSGASNQAGVVRALADGALEVWSGSTWLPAAPAGALSVGFWQHLGLVWTGDSVTAYVNGVAQQTAAADFHFAEQNGNFGIGARFLELHGTSFDGKIDEVAVFGAALSQAAISRLAGEQDATVIRNFKAKVSKINQERQQLLSQSGRRAMVMRERNPVRKAYIRLRGVYDRPGEEVQRGTPAFLPPLRVAGSLPNRMDLANWLVSAEHPLTARVTVNRFWQQFFGVGLVKTSEDFGAQGEWPSHSQLLDYLAVRFRESGWDVKGLVREIVCSATYRQQSDASAAAYQADPENRLLARGSRYRMDAEMIRDQMLLVSGTLNTELYGKSVKPPQPPGLWKSVTMTGEVFKQSRGADIRRRSLYTFWKRVMPPPQMSIMDAPSREYCVARRERTNTPLQALILMNEPEYLKLAHACAENTLREASNDPTIALPRLYERITSHKPTAAELAILQRALDDFERYYRKRPALAKSLFENSKGLDLERGDVRIRGAARTHIQALRKSGAQTAAWTMLAHSLLNLEKAKVRR